MAGRKRKRKTTRRSSNPPSEQLLAHLDRWMERAGKVIDDGYKIASYLDSNSGLRAAIMSALGEFDEAMSDIEEMIEEGEYQ